MTELTIPVMTEDLFTDEMRDPLVRALAPDNAARVFAVGRQYGFEDDRLEERGHGSAWYTGSDGEVISRSLFGAPIPVVVQCSAAFHVAWGHDHLVAIAEGTLKEMREGVDYNPDYTVVCLSFGLVILPPNPAIDLGIDATDRGKSCIDQEIVDSHLRLVLDAGLSAHARLDAISRAEALVATAISQGLAARNDRARWDDLFDDITFRAGPRRRTAS